jgi:hypothetical protein
METGVQDKLIRLASTGAAVVVGVGGVAPTFKLSRIRRA